MYLLVDPKWFEATPGEIDGVKLGGYAGADPEVTARWYRERLKNLRLVEVRGSVRLSDTADSSGELEDSELPAAEDSVPEDRKLFGLPQTIRLDDGGVAMRRLLDFSHTAVVALGGKWNSKTEDEFEASLNGFGDIRLTTNRDRALRQEDLALLGLEQPFIRTLLEKIQSLPASDRALIAANGQPHKGCLTFWAVTIHGKSGHLKQSIVRLALGFDGARRSSELRIRPEVAAKLGHYVYACIDPRNSEIFCVGKRIRG